MKSFAIALLASALLYPAAGFAQSAPFDMTPELQDLPATPEPVPKPPAIPPTPTTSPPATVPAKTESGESRRYLLQKPTLRLQGETAADGWTFYLTPEQAAADTSLTLTYTNAVVVAPEVSRLSVLVNGTSIVDHAIQGADAEQQLTVKMPAGVLLPGPNRIRIQADQRHRTDCTLDSTYELWTDIDASETWLSFAAPNANRPTRLEDIQAIGVDPKGRSRFLIVAPALGQTDAASALLKLSQGLSTLSGAVNASFAFSRELPAKTGPGDIVVIAATATELAQLPGAADLPHPDGPLAGFVSLPERTDTSALAFMGSDWKDIGALVDSFVALATSRGTDPTMLATANWRVSDTPLVEGARRLRLADLGVSGQEFSGRRFTTSFSVAMPEDFYANAYGTARILLDAAYSSKVLPGSRFNISVNGQLATTVPITAKGGAVLRHYPIRVSMQHFRPGVNTIMLEAMLATRSDAVCAPGSTAEKTPRFALFDTTEFVVPEFARMSRAPDLAATAGLGFPYRDTPSTAVVLGQRDEATLSTAATVLGKLSQAGGRSFPIELVNSASEAQGRNALMIGFAGDLPENALTEVSLPGSASSAPVAGGGEGLDAAAWRDKVESGAIFTLLADVNSWMRETFNLDLTAINFWPQSNTPYPLPAKAGIFVSQSVDTETETISTTVSVADRTLLKSGVTALADRDNWQALEGRVSFYDTARDRIDSVPTASSHVLSLRPLTLTNLRLVTANWLSSNFIVYAFCLAFSAVLLGLATHALLSRLGRGHDK